MTIHHHIIEPGVARLGLILCLALGLAAPAAAQSLDYPEARRADQVDVYHGIEVADPYRWMEDLASEELHAWMQAQDDLRADVMGEPHLVKYLQERIETLSSYASQGVPIMKGPRTFIYKTEAGKTYSKLYVRDRGHDALRMVLDLEPFNSDGQSGSVSSFSPDGRYLTYNTAEGQSRWRTTHLLRVDDDQRLTETLTGFYAGRSNIAWKADGEGFFYTRYAVPDDPQAPLGLAQVYYHRLGTPQTADVMIYERPDEVQISYYLRVTHDGGYLLLEASEDGGSFTGLVPRVFYKDLNDDYNKVQELFEGLGATYAFEGNRGTRFWIRTTHQAAQARLVEVDLARPAPAQWKEVIPEAETPMQAVSVVGERLVIQYVKDARRIAHLYDFEGRFHHEIDHLAPSMYGFADNPDGHVTYYGASQLYDPGTAYRLDVHTGESSLYFRPDLVHNPDDFVSKQVFFKSKDGTRVPMFILHRNDLKLDGTNPVFMYGYGAWAWAAFPWQWHMVPWMEIGGVYAVPGIRGGGEYGEAWHEAGIRHNKQKGIDDFIAAAEWLIDNNYTSPARMVANGGSASGILPGAAMIQRPGLFGASVINFPTMDQVRYTGFGSAQSWIPEYGDPDDPDDFKALYAYSPYHNLKPGACYPPTWIQVGEKDDTTTPMHGYKFAAALQAAQGCSKPVLLKIAWGAGHSYGLTPDQRRETQAEEIAFLVKVLDLDVSHTLAPASGQVMKK